MTTAAQETTRRTRPGAATALALAAGVTYTVAAAIVGLQADTEPVGVHYDQANRTLVLPLALLVAWAHRRGSRTITVGYVLMLAGVVLEFWGALLVGEHPSATARRLGEDSYFWGSDPGFGAFALGSVVVVVGFVLLARSRRGTTSRRVLIRTGATGVAGFAVTGLWTVSAAAAAAGALGFAVLLLMATED